MSKEGEGKMANVCKVGVLYLTFLIYRDGDCPSGFVSHCLELDIVATGETPPKAIDLLKELIEESVLAALEDDTLDKLCRPAPRKYWKMLAHATQYHPPKRTTRRHIKAAPVCGVNYVLAKA